MERFVHGIADVLIGKRKIFAIVFTIITLLFAGSATRIKLDPGFLKLIPIKHEYMRTMMEYMKDFSGANTLLVNLRWKGEGDIYNKEFMEALQKATDEVFYIPGVNRTKVSSLFTPSTYYIEITESGFNGEPVVPARYSGTPEQLAQVRKNVALSGQIGLIVSNDQKSAMIRADLQDYDPSKGQEEQRVDYWQVQEKLTEIRGKFENENIEVNIIGFARLLGDVIYGLLGVFVFFGVAFLITMALLYWYTRSIRLTVVALIVALLPVLWLIGTLPLIGFGIDPMSILVPFLIFSIGVSHAVQMTNAWRQEVVAGATSVEASHAAFCKLFIPGAVALLTNALGFAVIMFIDIPIVHELGITACIGVLLMIATNKMILPIILTRVKLEESSRQHSLKGPSPFMGGVWKALARCAEPKTALIVFAVCAVLLVVSTVASRKMVIGDSGKGVPELRYDSRYNYDDRMINSNYNIGTDVLTIIAEAKEFEGDSCLHYEVVDLIDRLELYVRGIDGVQSVTSVAGIGKLVISAFNEGNPRYRALPRSQTGLSTGSKAFDPNLGLNNESCRAIQVLIFMKNHDGTVIAHAMDDIKKFIAANPVKGVKLRLASGNVGVMAATNEAVASAEVTMLLAIFGALALLCLLTFRSVTAVICIIVPLTMVSIFCNALMAMLGIGLKVATLPVVALGVGVGVDYGIYLFERIQHDLDGGMDFRTAFYEAMRQRGTAAVFTAITMAIGVGTWAFSALKFQADMGILLAFMFLVNMLGAICLLPALGAWFYRPKAPALGTSAAVR